MQSIDTVNSAVKPYIEYLDKEASIQGILTAFCVAGIGLYGEKVLGASNQGGDTVLYLLQVNGFWSVVATITSLGIAGFLFYAQRSLLVFRLGYITLALTKYARADAPTVAHQDGLFRYIKEAEAATIWNRYKTGLWWLGVSGVECILGLCLVKVSVTGGLFTILTVTPLLIASIATLHYRPWRDGGAPAQSLGRAETR